MATYTDNYNLVKPTMAETADIRTINGNMDSVDNIMHATQVSLAPAYDTSETYNTGDIVMYEFLMYECLDDEVTGTWDATKWQRTTAGEHGGGGGGSDVEITPTLQSGTKIADFEIDGVSGALYAPSGGGGGGGGSSQTIADVLWSGSETPSAGTPYTATLSNAITEYDLIVIDAYENNEGTQMQLSLPVSNIVYGEKYSDYYYNTANYVEITDSTHIDFIMFASANLTVYTKITGLKFCGTLAPMIYSAEEREVGVWVDDKPLYQKTFDLTSQALTDNTWNNGILGTTGISIKSYKGYFNLGTGAIFPYEYYRNNSEFFTVVTDQNSSDINVRPNMNAGTPVYAGIVTIWYTKNSDVAGSGSYGSLGVPMEHYDSAERVVGTYFGETLYQKTIPNISITGTTNTISTGANIGTLVAVEATGYKIDGGGNIIRFKESYNDGGYTFDVEGINNDIRVICSSWFNGSTVDITIKYTKSTT